MSEWTKERPTAPGYYLAFGWPFENWEEEFKIPPDVVLVRVQKIADYLLFQACGRTLNKISMGRVVWKTIDVEKELALEVLKEEDGNLPQPS